MTKKYFLSDGEARLGPYSKEELADMFLSPDTLILPHEGADWQTASSDPDVAAAMKPAVMAQMEALTARIAEEDAGGEMGAQSGEVSAQAMQWGPTKEDACTKPGYRQHSAILWNIPWGQDWEQACFSHPNTIKGHYFAKPHRCKHSGTNMWGEWDVPDGRCSDATTGTNALVFLLPNEPLELGHVGWGFQNSNGSWTWGATETSGVAKMPGTDNGTFVETGSKEQMLSAMRSGNRKNGKRYFPYYSYKMLRATMPNPDAARFVADSLKDVGYTVIGNNCMDHTIRVLNQFSTVPMFPLPGTGPNPMWAPRFWFTMIPGEERMINESF